MQTILIPQAYGDMIINIRDYVSKREGLTMVVFEPNADRRAVMEFEQNLGTYGLHEKCNRCSHSCIQYSAPNLYFYCADFNGREK